MQTLVVLDVDVSLQKSKQGKQKNDDTKKRKVVFLMKRKEEEKDWPHQVLILGPSTRRVDVIPLHHKAS